MRHNAYDDAQRPVEADRARMAAHEGISVYFRCSDAGAVDEHLRAHGANVSPPRVARYGTKQIYVRDADGYLLRFQHAAEHLAPRQP